MEATRQPQLLKIKSIPTPLTATSSKRTWILKAREHSDPSVSIYLPTYLSTHVHVHVCLNPAMYVCV